MPILTPQSDKFIRALVEELEIPEAFYAQAERSYKSFGDWTHRDASTINKYSPEVYVQGSFRLGTAIRPSNDADEYDIDIVCVLQDIDKSDGSQKNIKRLLGVEVKSYRDAKSIGKPVKEGSRCWTLEYADDVQFHMDILPAIPNAEGQRILLESRGLDASFCETAIAITDKDHPKYDCITEEWPRSNPKGYSKWFKDQMAESFDRIRAELLEAETRKGVEASIEDIPEYRVRTPLQQAVMILKRHRDDMFSDNPEIKPISIIITTLAGHSYNGETEIGDALLGILEKITNYIRIDGQKHIIANPTDATENFADKWVKHPERQAAFFKWVKQAQSDFLGLSKLTNYETMMEANTMRISSGLRNRAMNRIQGTSLLAAASAAPAAAESEHSFSDTPRKPKAPRNFA